jgi:DNA-binding IclR family transcriptional regulator
MYMKLFRIHEYGRYLAYDPTPDDIMNGLVKSATRVTVILELLADVPDGMTLSEISETLNIPPSSMHALINTLLVKGYLLRDAASQRYKLGPKLPQITAIYQSHLDLISIASPFMDQLVSLTGESILLTRLDGNKITYLKVNPGLGMIKIISDVGTHLPAHACGSGKAMLAQLPDTEIDLIYPEEQFPIVLPNTIKTKQELRQSLQVVRQQGYAIDKEEAEPGVWAMASCIRNSTGRPLAALAIGAPSFRFSAEIIEIWAKALVHSALSISVRFGFHDKTSITSGLAS